MPGVDLVSMVAMRFASHGDTIQKMAVMCKAVVVQTVMKMGGSAF